MGPVSNYLVLLACLFSGILRLRSLCPTIGSSPPGRGWERTVGDTNTFGKLQPLPLRPP